MKAKIVKAVVTSYMELAELAAAQESERHVQDWWHLEPEAQEEASSRKDVNPFTKEPFVFKAKPASKTVRALAMKKLKEMVN